MTDLVTIMSFGASYNEQWSPDGLIENDEIDTPEYYDLYDDLLARLCEVHEEDHDKDKVCCSEDDIKVGSFSELIQTISSNSNY